MPTVADESAEASSLRSGGLWSFIRAQLNFYRIHVLYFTFTPLIFSAIFYASNGDTHISYIDALFNCVSALCVCGLATVDLSSLTPWQQTLLFIQMCIGSPITVSWVVVFARRRLFMQKCQNILNSVRKPKTPESTTISENRPLFRRWLERLSRATSPSTSSDEGAQQLTSKKHHAGAHNQRHDSSRKLGVDMIRRMDDAPRLVDPNGWISAVHSDSPSQNKPPTPSPAEESQPPEIYEPRRSSEEDDDNRSASPKRGRASVSPAPAFASGADEPRPFRADLARVLSRDHVNMPRTQTIEFAPEPLRVRRASVAPSRRPTISEVNPPLGLDRINSRSSAGNTPGLGTIRSPSSYAASTYPTSFTAHRSMRQGFGGFPLPHTVIGNLLDRAFPKLRRTFTRTVTLPRTQTIISNSAAVHAAEGARLVPYISFDAIVGHNSVFHELTHEQLEELGGVEYKGLTSLLWLIPLYTLGVLLLSFIVIAPYVSSVDQFRAVFRPPTQHKDISPSWFTLFQIVSAFTNTGTSLVDQSMIPFQRAYPMIIFLTYLILAGNTAFPVFFRFLIWLTAKILPRQSSLNETLQFLLDHPRRCYIYLFPSPQTWFLFVVVICLNLTDWVFFLVLDIGNSEIEALPVGVRMIDGLLQSAAVRSSGFAIVGLSGLAPSVRVAYVIMMYISVYPIAMSVRSTNVYEDQSLGIYDEDQHPEDEDDEFATVKSQRMAVWGKHLAMHMRHQLSFDIWWLAFALFLVCIIERPALTNDDAPFEIFTIIFELVSAYGGVGMSLGLPTANYSTSGAFRTLSKLVVIAVMLRGRHRGLPVAIDRAVVLPFEFKRDADAEDVQHSTEMQRFGTTMTGASARAAEAEVRRRAVSTSRGAEEAMLRV